ncbi:hypothetical protein CONLIGDRAFT_636426 [Coniochaeta ligniaria NRRL 30616]|uniref:Yeast cell wall synthesis Kre9/Knh1-like N-terminal domain-containing protein n=1 Tax=Coniochaeta ligniaria NRRL 30616 TaxID=1408157 RepID=A0A1J7ICE0_9PEZI|nr:hypothetical protein CONLIGDRAFT_636426 [Coniochaeta ligniaria NRRL 30616]
MVTSPTKDQKVDFSSSIDIVWTSVSTDPSTFDLVLVDQTNMVPIPIKTGVKTSDNKYTLTNFVATPGSAYKFNFLSTDPLNTGILAQSQTFEIIKSGGASTSDSSSSTSTTTTSSSTGTGVAAGGSDSTSTTLSTKTTTSGTPSKTGSAAASDTANASSSATTPVKSGNAAVALNGKTFGVAGSVFAGLLMLF